MAKDTTTAVRRVVLPRLKTDAELLALVPVASIHPQETPALPTFPFVRYGAPSLLPVRAIGMDGADVSFAVHAFSKGRVAGGKLVETAEDHAARIGAAIAKALDAAILTAGGVGQVKVRWRGSQLLQDPAEAGCFHSVQLFVARCY